MPLSRIFFCSYPEKKFTAADRISLSVQIVFMKSYLASMVKESRIMIGITVYMDSAKGYTTMYLLFPLISVFYAFVFGENQRGGNLLPHQILLGKQ